MTFILSSPSSVANPIKISHNNYIDSLQKRQVSEKQKNKGFSPLFYIKTRLKLIMFHVKRNYSAFCKIFLSFFSKFLQG